MALLARAASSRRRRRPRLSVRQAVALGLIQGPTEVLPLSSSGHLVLVPALLDWPYARLPADVRKSFEVALHTGAGLALAWVLRDDLIAAIRNPAATGRLAAPAAVAGLAFEDAIEKRASRPSVTAAAMIAGGAGLVATDSATNPRVRVRPLLEGCIGVAQAAALVPGVSRNGATVTAARALGFDPETASRLSWRAGLPIIGGATLLKLVRLRQRGLAPELRAPFAVGAAAAFGSTLVAAPLLGVRRYALVGAYRIALGAFALHRLEWPRG
jgi:undecaprenyl-diphosphatase